MGIETAQPIVNQKAQEFNFTNEGGVNRHNSPAQEHNGMWLLQESTAPAGA